MEKNSVGIIVRKVPRNFLETGDYPLSLAYFEIFIKYLIYNEYEIIITLKLFHEDSNTMHYYTYRFISFSHSSN